MFDNVKYKLIEMDKACKSIVYCNDCKYFNECSMDYCPEEALEIINNAENIIKSLKIN